MRLKISFNYTMLKKNSEQDSKENVAQTKDNDSYTGLGNSIPHPLQKGPSFLGSISSLTRADSVFLANSAKEISKSNMIPKTRSVSMGTLPVVKENNQQSQQQLQINVPTVVSQPKILKRRASFNEQLLSGTKIDGTTDDKYVNSNIDDGTNIANVPQKKKIYSGCLPNPTFRFRTFQRWIKKPRAFAQIIYYVPNEVHRNIKNKNTKNSKKNNKKGKTSTFSMEKSCFGAN